MNFISFGQAAKKFCNKKNFIVLDNEFNYIKKKQYKNIIYPHINIHQYNKKKEILLIKRKNNFKYLIKTYKIVLKNLANILNKYHQKSYTVAYWEVLIGRWLFFYISNVYYYWYIIQKVSKKKKIKNFISLPLEENSFVPNDTFHAIKIINNSKSLWSHWCMREIAIFLKLFEVKEIKIKINYKEIIKKSYTPIYTLNTINLGLNKKLFFYRFYLPIRLKLIFFFRIGVFPIRLKSLLIKFTNIVTSKRSDFSVYKIKKDKFLNFCNFFLSKNIPKIFLENFNDLSYNYEKLNWPKKPKYIITTHGQYYDEIFKFYLAQQKSRNCKLMINQHGSILENYNNTQNIHYYIDYQICDKILTWANYNKFKCEPLFVNTVDEKKNRQKFKNNKILLVTYNLGHNSIVACDTFVSTFQQKELLSNMIKDFIFSLKSIVEKDIIVKHYCAQEPDLIKINLKRNFPNLDFIKTKKLAYEIKKNFCLQVETFLSTGFFEALYLRNPVILINNSIMHGDIINSKLFNSLKKLKKYQIYFDNPILAADFINKNNNNLYEWWNNKDLQNEVNNFCDQHCRSFNTYNKNFIKKLSV
jgi:putative transferase (TIGR04331 family)